MLFGEFLQRECAWQPCEGGEGAAPHSLSVKSLLFNYTKKKKKNYIFLAHRKININFLLGFAN